MRLNFSRNGSASLALDYVNVDRRSDRHQVEFWLVTLMRICREVTATRLADISLALQKADVDLVRGFVTVPAAYAKNGRTRTVPLNSTVRAAQVNDNIAIDYLACLDRSDVITGVTRKVIDLLPDGECSRDKVASALGMSPGTLQLKLSQHGTNFQKLLDDTRKELGCSYVQQPTRSVTEITFLLGFNDTSNFTRAFKRWTGMSPTEYRHKR